VEWADSPIDWRVLLFAVVGTLLTGAFAGLVPALPAASPDLTDSLKAGSRDTGPRRSLLRSFLVMAQAALSVVLLVGSVLFVRSLHNVKETDFGYTVSNLGFASVEYESRDSARDAGLPTRIRSLDGRVAAIPGVQRVAVTQFRPKAGYTATRY